MEYLGEKKAAEPLKTPWIHESGKKAERTAGIVADRKRVLKYDLYLRSDWSVNVFLLAMGVGMGVLSVWLLGKPAWWWDVLGVITALVALFLACVGLMELWDLFGGGRCRAYGEGLLIGGVVVRENPLTVAALTSVGEPGTIFVRYFDGARKITRQEYEEAIRKKEEVWYEEWQQQYMTAWTMYRPEAAERIWREFWDPVYDRFRRLEGKWGCMLRTVGQGDWSYKVGDRIPCSSLYDDLNEKRRMWTEVHVLPLVWGTRNREDLERCIEAVPQAEWELLEEIAPLLAQRKEETLYLLHWVPEGGRLKYGFEAAGTVK